MQDIEKTCRDCSKPFLFTVGEQEFYKQKGFENEPTRCPECAKAKKARFARGGNRDGGFKKDRY